jgi:hypothetical protein
MTVCGKTRRRKNLTVENGVAKAEFVWTLSRCRHARDASIKALTA